MFWNDLPKSLSNITILPFFHSTESVNLRSIFENGKITSTHCDVYKQELSYLFYGRPGYRGALSPKATRRVEYYPVVLILKDAAVESIARMMPFDSGAFEKGAYSDYIHPSIKKEQFEIPPPINNLMNVISYFYTSNENYFFSKSECVDVPRPTRFELSSYLKMINHEDPSISDDRRATLEVQSTKSICLDKGHLIGVIAPSVFTDEPYFEKRRVEWNFEFEGYDLHIANPREVYGVLFERSKKILSTLGRL